MNQTRNNDAGDTANATVFIVDDDDAMRRGLEFLISSAGYKGESFDSGKAFLDYYKPAMHGCLLLDVRMPGMSGLELQEHLRDERITVPVILVTAYADVPTAVRAMQAGASDFIEKPFEGSELLKRIRRALARDAETQKDDRRLRKIRGRLETLTPRERQVMELVVDGLLNKQIASELGISMKTVENHRARVMEKMKVVSLAHLVRLAMAADIC